MGRPAQIMSANCLRRRASLTSAKRGGIVRMHRSPASIRMTTCVVLMWAVLVCGFGLSSAISDADDLDSDLIETETGWRFADDDNIQAFDAAAPAAGNSTGPAPAPAKAISGRVPLKNGDFEQAVMVAGAGDTLITSDANLPNWYPGGAGVFVTQGYKYSSFDPSSKYAVHLNNPFAANYSQGSITTLLTPIPAKGKTFTIQYDCARNPNGPTNQLSAVKVSSQTATTTTAWQMHHVKYNATDNQTTYITWSRMSFVFTGTGAALNITMESMSERYGPVVDNVVMLTGSHPLSAAPSMTSLLSVWQRPLFTAAVVMASFHSQLLSLL
ncbi:hypothetical protein KC19_1G039700 [Ceratodon purpureus]|uniref:DUF642 domain-containing protein n=1 Tax=Ceratodon purpureus TaxID=3225 RepID=A0A8T0J4J3_CERPU|nr:hypothetical protein KC19_1G039700 [Ceratodon purpureus]